MANRPHGLWPFTETVLDEIDLQGGTVESIEAHDANSAVGSDFVWGKLPSQRTDTVSGCYMKIEHNGGEYSFEFGHRACQGIDPTFGGSHLLPPTRLAASLMARDFVDYFRDGE